MSGRDKRGNAPPTIARFDARHPDAVSYGKRGRPTDINRWIELAKVAWHPVLDLLGREELRFADLDARPYVMHSPDGFSLPPEMVIRHSQRVLESKGQVRWLTGDEVVRIHDEMVAAYGGEPGTNERPWIDTYVDYVRDSAMRGGFDPLPSLIHKAAYLMHSILVYHPFVDGQKRTGLSAAFVFLGMNGYFLWSRDLVDELHFAVHVAKGEAEVEQIAEWLAARVAYRNLFPSPEFIDSILGMSSPRRRQCSVCGDTILLNRSLVACKECKSVYRVTLNAVLVRTAGKGPKVIVQPGISLVPTPAVSEQKSQLSHDTGRPPAVADPDHSPKGPPAERRRAESSEQ